jgi:hypothetical protein
VPEAPGQHTWRPAAHQYCHASHPTPFPLPSWPACSHLRMPCRIARLSLYALGQHRNDGRMGGSAPLSSGSIHTTVSRRIGLRGGVHSVPSGRQIVPRFRLSDADGKSRMKLMRTRTSTGACMRAAGLHTQALHAVCSSKSTPLPLPQVPTSRPAPLSACLYMLTTRCTLHVTVCWWSVPLRSIHIHCRAKAPA